MPGDLLQTGEPKRLTCHAGRWFLEVERLVAVDANLFEPRVQQLEGAQALLGFLKQSPAARSLLAGTHELLKSQLSDTTRSFVNVNGEWVPSQLSPAYIRQLTHKQHSDPQRSRPQELNNLRTDLLLMRASQERLEERLARLERMVHNARPLTNVLPQDLTRLGAEQPATQKSAEKPPSESPRVEDSIASMAEQFVQAPTLSAAQAPELGKQATTSTRQRSTRPEANAAAHGRKLALPGTAKVSECLKTLLGDSVSLRKVPPTTNYKGDLDGFWISSLRDDEGKMVAAILANLPCVVQLGGELMMLPESELDQQIAQKTPSEDTIAAMSEVCNTLTGIFNQIPGNDHVRSDYLEIHGPAHAAWLESAKRVVEFDTGSDGVLLLISPE